MEESEVSVSSIRDNSEMNEVFPGLSFTGRPAHKIISLIDEKEISNVYFIMMI
jgi:hypothetical protein